MESDIDDNDTDTEESMQDKSSNNKSLKCSTCGKQFTNPYDRKNHELTHAPDFPYKCPHCPFRAKTKKYISTHKKRKHMEIKGPQCKVCGKVFIYRSKLEEHEMVHTGEKPFKCDYCPKAFRVTSSLKSHLLIHTNEKPYKCSFCDYACRDNSTLRKHQNKHMGLTKFYNCTICHKGFKHKYLLKNHISELHMKIDIRKHKCDICGGMFKSYSLLNAHVRVVHDKIYASQCQICGVKVSNKYNLKTHMLSHVDYRPYRCTHKGCTRRFKAMYDLKKHTIIHKPELHYKCHKCEATFTRRHRLEKHKHTHKERKKHVICDYCGDSFYTKNYIIKHIKEKHTNRQRYVCDVCGIKCNNKPGLVMHLKYAHMECKQENECKMCHTKYKKYEYLKSHYLRTHNIKYKMVKPQTKIKVENEDNEAKPEVVVKMEPIDEDYETLSLLDIDKEEIQDPDYTEYSRNVLNEDVTNCILRPNGNCDESEFDHFLVTHMTSNAKEEIDNTELTEECDPEILQKANDRIAELLKTSEKLRKAEKKRIAAKKLAKKNRIAAKKLAEKNRIAAKKLAEKNRIAAKQSAEKNRIAAEKFAEKKKQKEELKKKEEEELEKKQENELKELEMLRVKYNEIISNLKNKPKKKENTKIIYYKANKNNISNEKVQNENDSVQKVYDNDLEDDETDFTVKTNKNNTSNENLLNVAVSVEKIYDNDFDDETDFTLKPNTNNTSNENLQNVTVSVEKINDNDLEDDETDFTVKPNKNNTSNKNVQNVTVSVEKIDDDDFDDETDFTLKPNTNNTSNENLQNITVSVEKIDENDLEDDETDFTVKSNKDNNLNIENDSSEKNDADDEIEPNKDGQSNSDLNEINDYNENDDLSNKHANFFDGDDYSEEEISFAIKPTNNQNDLSNINDNEILEKNSKNDEKDAMEDEIIDTHDENTKMYTNNDKMNSKCVETNDICVESIENDNPRDETNKVPEENIENDNISDETNDKNDETSVTNDKNSESDNVIITRSGRKLKRKTFFGDENDKHPKLNFKSHQCYICFKLYPTKQELIDHCQVHFDVCSLRTLTKCPICNYVTHKCLSHHILKEHKINLKIPFTKMEEKPDKVGSKYYYNAEGTIIDVIPSIKALNFNANKALEKQNKINKNQSITKTKLIKKGTEWIVQKEDLDTDFDLLPEFTETEYKKLKISDNYIDRFKQIYKLTKKLNIKMAFPCLDCKKICQNASALKLHNRLHQKNPKPFKSREEVKKEKLKKAKIAKNRKIELNIDTRAPKPIKNKHKCDEKLKEFYENNIKGGDIEFWQFLKIFNKMDREDINEFEQLESRKDFGIHTMKDKRLIVAKNNKKQKPNPLKNDLNTLKKQNINKEPNTSNKNNTVIKNTSKKSNTSNKESNTLKNKRLTNASKKQKTNKQST